MPMRENYSWLEEPSTTNLAHNSSHKERIFSILIAKFLKTYVISLLTASRVVTVVVLGWLTN